MNNNVNKIKLKFQISPELSKINNNIYHYQNSKEKNNLFLLKNKKKNINKPANKNNKKKIK